MSSQVVTIFRKEVLDNFRDRRALMSSLVFAPIFGPLMFAILISVAVEQTFVESDEKVELPVVGEYNAPDLIAFLSAHDTEIVSGLESESEARQAVRDGRYDLVLVIDGDYADKFTSGLPAVVRLVVDHSNKGAAKHVFRVSNLLNAYNATLASMRLRARGVSTYVLHPLSVDEIDVSTPAGRSVLLLGMMTYLLLAVILFGGMYLAIDTTAGERDRGTLEPLLTLPVPRTRLIIGKMLATLFFMLLSLSITLAGIAISLNFVPLEELGMRTHFTLPVALKAFAIMLPFAVLGTSLLTVVASFTRSYKEAQTYLSIVIAVPTLPIVLAIIYSVRPSLYLMTVPSLSQHLLMTELMKGESLDLASALVSAAATTLLGIALGWVATLLYNRERILG